jgi:hypothetical protein
MEKAMLYSVYYIFNHGRNKVKINKEFIIAHQNNNKINEEFIIVHQNNNKINEEFIIVIKITTK